ncbi:MAG: hypothetical protein ABIS38_04125 [Sphingomicrobium sp.]
MTKRTILRLLPLLGALGACNMVISEKPMFDGHDRSTLIPRDGIWLAEVEDCRFDSSKPEPVWPKCAVRAIVDNGGRQLQVSDGKGQSQRLAAIFTPGAPVIVQGQWVDQAKRPAKVFYGFFGLEAGAIGSDRRFGTATMWPVACGVQLGSGIRSFPGISADCRPSSKRAIRAAATSSRGDADAFKWRWLRAKSR